MANPYNYNTNFDNEKKYLDNIISNGSAGEKAWAQSQMGMLGQAQAESQAMGLGIDPSKVDPTYASNLATGGGYNYGGGGSSGGNPGTSQSPADSESALWGRIDDLLSQLSNQQKAPVYTPPAVDYMSDAEAKAKAEGLLLPMFNKSKSDLQTDMAKLAARRGIDTSAAGLRISSDAQSDLESQYNSNLSGLMQQLLSEDKSNANQTLDRAFNQWAQQEQLNQSVYNSNVNNVNSQLGMLFNLLGYNTNKAFNEAQLTGSYNGSPTLAAKQLDEQINQNFLDNYGYNPDTGEATLNGKKYKADAMMNDFQKAQVMASLTGRIYGLSGYGIPDGTAMYKPSSGGSSSLNPNLALSIWELTGQAPAGLEKYGVQPGTKWTGKTDIDPEQVQFEKQAWFTDTSNRLSNKYGIARQVADIVASSIDPDTSGTSPEAQWQSWLIDKASYAGLDGVTPTMVNQAERILKQELGISTDTKDPTKIVYNTPGSGSSGGTRGYDYPKENPPFNGQTTVNNNLPQISTPDLKSWSDFLHKPFSQWW